MTNKFKEGQMVKIIRCIFGKEEHEGRSGRIDYIYDDGDIIVDLKNRHQCIAREVEKIESEVKMKKRYQLLKETDSLKKGAIVEEMCDDDKHYKVLDHKYCKGTGFVEYVIEAIYVVNNPKWWQEVVPMYVTKEEEKKIKKILKK